jgi:hypothetical protein
MLDSTRDLPKDQNQDTLHCDAFNAAFYELGLRWHWDMAAYRRLQPDSAGMKERIRHYLESEHPHLLKAYNAEFLIDAILEQKARNAARLSCGSAIPLNVDWAAFQDGQIGV